MEGKEERPEDIGIEVPSGVEGMLGYEYSICDSGGPIDHIPARIDLDKIFDKKIFEVCEVVNSIYQQLKEIQDKSILFEGVRLCVFIKLTKVTVFDWIKIELLLAQIFNSINFPIIIFDSLSTETFIEVEDELTLYKRNFAVLDFVSASSQKSRIFNLLDMEDCCSIYLMRPPFVN